MSDQDSSAPTPEASSSGPHLAHDLRAIREDRSVSLDDVQRDTRMPADILKRFEAGDLIGDAHYNEVYLRNLLKSYAKALSISPHEVVVAYDQAKEGNYDGGLRRRYLGGGTAAAAEQEQREAKRPKPADEKPADPAPAEQPAEQKEKSPQPSEEPRQVPSKRSTSGTAPAVSALSSPPPKPEKEERAEASTTSLPKRRVASETEASKPIEKSWGVIIAGTVVALIVIAGVLWFLFRDPSPELEPVAETPPAADTASASAAASDSADASPQPIAVDAPQFTTPIELTVVAGDQPLENFRVKVDDDARRPYWVEPGETESFTAQQEVAVWGELPQGGDGGGAYDGARLRLQGLEWMPPDGRVVRISAQNGQAILDSLARR